jgi:4-hydroxy-2-oxoheptanedioate aldolase
VGGPPLEQAIARVLEVAHAHNLIAGMHCASGRVARERAAQGFELITVAVDSALFSAAIAQQLADAVS